MYYINCRMCWVRLSGTQRLRLLSQLSFYLILILIYLNTKRDTVQSLPMARSRGRPTSRRQCGRRRGAVSRESSRLRRISVLDAENLRSVSISEEMGPGGACVILHLLPTTTTTHPPIAVPKAPAACSRQRRHQS